MKKLIALVFTSLMLLSPYLLLLPLDSTGNANELSTGISLDIDALADEFGSEIPLVVSFESEVDTSMVTRLANIGIRFSFGSPSESRIGSYYLIRGEAQAIRKMLSEIGIDYIAPQSNADHMKSTRDVSMEEINATQVWQSLDEYNRTVTGKGITIADLDTGIDWTHPDFWYANGSAYNWTDFDTNSIPTNGTDYIDLDEDGARSADEIFYIIDLDNDGNMNATTDWLWVDNETQNAVPDIGEPFFVVNDTNSNDLLDLGEQLILLNKPKTKYIVEADGTPSRDIQVWDRNTNLTISTHEDTDGHGTAVSGILLGGQLGYRKYVGAAPDAELMMIRVLGDSNDWLTIEEGLTWAFSHGAEVILIEVGSWTYDYLDGSSTSELLIDTIVAAGVPVIAPSGNLGGQDKHALLSTETSTPAGLAFSIPPVGGPPSEGSYISVDIENVYITILSVNTTDFTSCSFSITMDMGGTPGTRTLNPGSGYLNWASEPLLAGGGYSVQIKSFISMSSRGTRMLGIHLTGTLPTTSTLPWHTFNVTSPQPTVYHAYISDDASSWAGGSIWKTNVSDNYQITWPSTADSALSVASYRVRDLVGGGTIGDIADFSSRGPRIDGTLKQGIAAPGGYDIISSYSNESTWYSWYNAYGVLDFNARFASYQLFSGTSASGPHVAGAAALMLQANATCGSDVGDIIKSTASQDSFTRTVPNSEWGYGKLDAYLAVLEVSPVSDSLPPDIGVPSVSPSTPTSADIVTIEVSVSDPSGVDSVILEYHNGTVWNNVTMVPFGGVHSASIPQLPNATVVIYRIYANDSLGYETVSPDYTYAVFDSSTTTTTTDTTTTTTDTSSTSTGTDTSNTSGTSPTSSTNPLSPNYLNLAVMLGLIGVFAVLSCIITRRREEYR